MLIHAVLSIGLAGLSSAVETSNIAARVQANPLLLPGTKRCPDGPIIRTIDQCPVTPDHRFEMTHEPDGQVRTRRWWCRGSAKASEVTVSINRRPYDRTTQTLPYVSRLEVITVSGRPAPPALKRSIQQQIDAFDRFDDFGGRCLFVRSGGTVPVLTLHGVAMKDGKLEWKHEEIRLEER